MHSPDKGSAIARGGFQNEDDVVRKFNNWLYDVEARQWLVLMGFSLEEITTVKALKVTGHKTDVQVQVFIELKTLAVVQNLQVKLVSNLRGFNQVDKRWVATYAHLWEMPAEIADILKRYTGEIQPTRPASRDRRRMCMDEFSQAEQGQVIDWFSRHKVLIISDILKGRGPLATEWMLVLQKTNVQARWVLTPMNLVLNHFAQGEVALTARGNLTLGRVTFQRKGGDGGRPTANMLQFKINPAELFSS